MKSRATSPQALMRCCCSTAPDGIPPASSTCPPISRRSSCRRAPRSSTRSRTSGSISARTGSQTPSSKTTTPSSTPHAPRGESSSLSPKRSPPSECANGLTSVNRYDLWYQTFGSDDAAASLLITKTNTATISPAGSTPIDLSNIFNAVSGNQIVTDGLDSSATTPTGAPHDPFGLDPRSAIGVSEDGRFLYLIAIDGRQPGYSVGVTTSDEAALMIDLGIFDGLNLDGGGSTALVQAGAGGSPDLIDSPSGSFGVVERLDGNNLGVFASALPTPEASTWLMMLAGFGGMALLARRKMLLSAN